jgi:hypothetical protein
MLEIIKKFAEIDAIEFTFMQGEKMLVCEIKSFDIKKTLMQGEIIEEYLDDKPYPSFLLCAKLDEKYLHVVCAVAGKQLLIITTYYPDENIWLNPRKRR